MKLAVYNNRFISIKEREDKLFGIDIEKISKGRFTSNVLDVLDKWEDFIKWCEHIKNSEEEFNNLQEIIDINLLDAPIPNPRQIFAIGMNYKGHAKEVGLDIPNYPSVFTKFPSSVCGPNVKVKLPSDSVDWEVELVAVISKRGRNISREDAWDYVAGFTVGQDLSERLLQFEGQPPQFSMGKSYENFAPIGPWLTTLDEVINKSDLKIECIKNKDVVQSSRTCNMIYDIPELIVKLSSVVELFPGDLVFTGTPEGVGLGRTPQEYLKRGDILMSNIEGLGEIKQEFV